MAETKIGVKDAVRIAAEYVRDLFSDERIEDLRLEEVETSDDGENWFITLGFSRPELRRDSQPLIERLRPLEREYRQVHILAKTGDVRSVKIRRP